MIMGNTPGVIGITDKGTTIAIHPIAVKEVNDKKKIETLHNLNVYSIQTPNGLPVQTANMLMSEESLKILLESIGNYLEMLEDKKALVNADGPDDSHE